MVTKKKPRQQTLESTLGQPRVRAVKKSSPAAQTLKPAVTASTSSTSQRPSSTSHSHRRIVISEGSTDELGQDSDDELPRIASSRKRRALKKRPPIPDDD